MCYNVHILNTIDVQDHELEILEKIYSSNETKGVRQRDLAQIVGISLGMTNAIIGRLVTKGLIAISKINNRNLHYAVTSKGIEEIAKRSYRFLKRTVRNVVYYKDILENFLLDIKVKGLSGIVLVGRSDFDFILSHLCNKHNLSFEQSPTACSHFGISTVFSEEIPPHSSVEGGVSLRDILIGL